MAIMISKESMIVRAAWLRGFIEGVTLFAIWKDGEQLVGCMRKPLKEELHAEIKELKELEKELAQ